MLKNQTYGLILFILVPIMKEISGSSVPAPIEAYQPYTISTSAKSVATQEVISVDASVYFPEAEQTDDTPLITADGSHINEQNPRKHKWLALSRDLLAKWGGEIEFGDSVHVAGISPKLDGIYIVRDVMNERMKNRVDILVGSNDKIMGFWEDVKLTRLN